MDEHGDAPSPVLGQIGKILLIAAPPLALVLALAMSSQRTAAAAACSGSPGDRVDCGNSVFSPGQSFGPARGRSARGGFGGHGAAHGGGGHGAGA